MDNINYPKNNDLDEIMRIDSEVVGDDNRWAYIKRAIEDDRCLVFKSEQRIVGFLIFDTHFFEHAFISLVIVSPSERKKGVAKALIYVFENISPTEKIFSSTNLSNEVMHNLFHSLGYIKSGTVENLDEGDPEIIYFKHLSK